MVTPRATSVRATRIPGARRRVRPDPNDFLPEQVADPRRPRSVVSYALARRAALQSLRRGLLSFEHCDADPALLRAAKYHGEPADHDCPVCRKDGLVEIFWVFGAQLGPLSGSARSRAQLAAMADEYGAFRVHAVEVCPRCSWNHLVISFTLGDGHPRNRPGADA